MPARADADSGNRYGKGIEMSEPINLPFKVCKSRVQHDCEKCGHVMILAENGARVRLGKYKCLNCGHPFRVEEMPDGSIGTILSPIDNTK